MKTDHRDGKSKSLVHVVMCSRNSAKRRRNRDPEVRVRHLSLNDHTGCKLILYT